MSEPRLETIEDYNTLKGEKRRVLWAVLLAFFILGGIYVLASSIYGKTDDAIQTQETIKNIPLK